MPRPTERAKYQHFMEYVMPPVSSDVTPVVSPEQREQMAKTVSAYRHGSQVAWDEDVRLTDAILTSPVFASIIRDAKAGAWDEGASAGVYRTLRGEAVLPDLDNPYRTSEGTNNEH